MLRKTVGSALICLCILNGCGKTGSANKNTLDGQYVSQVGTPWWNFHGDTGVVEYYNNPDRTFTVDNKGFVTIKAHDGSETVLKIAGDKLVSNSGIYFIRASAYKPPTQMSQPTNVIEYISASGQQRLTLEIWPRSRETPDGSWHGGTFKLTDVTGAKLREGFVDGGGGNGLVLGKGKDQILAETLNGNHVVFQMEGGKALKPDAPRDFFKLGSPEAQAVVAPITVDAPLSSYESADQIALLGQFYSLSTNAVDYEGDIQKFDSAYDLEANGFKKRDMMKSFKNELDAAIQHAKEHHLLRLPPFDVQVPAFDFNDMTYYFGSVVSPENTITGTNCPCVAIHPSQVTNLKYKTINEEEARAIEGKLSKNGRSAYIRLYGKVIKSDRDINQNPNITLAVTHVDVLLDPGSSKPLFSVDVH